MSGVRTWQVIALLSVVSFGVTALEIPRTDWFTLAAFSLASGVTAFSMMAAAAVLGARWTFIESLFGGLDRVYLTHKWLGVWALVFASVHLAFKAGMSGWEVAPVVTLAPGATRLVRQLSYIAVMLIVLLALNRHIPYHRWRWWHKLSGPLFLIVILHQLSIKSPIALASPAGVWLALVALLGVGAAFYKLFLYRWMARHAEYRVVDLEPGPGAVRVRLAPLDRPLPFEAGQFGFLRLKQEGLREPHPFTIATAGRADGQVEFLIRNLGDYTRRLIAEIWVGMVAEIYAPYGRFTRASSARREVWIGGGVGISPFVAWLRDENCACDKVTLFYCYTPERAFPDPELLANMARERGAEFVAVTDSAVLNEQLAEIAREAGPEAVAISFCGPKGLLAQVRKHMQRAQIPPDNLRYEHFEFR
jgi:predicted ferric reductase